MAVTINDIKKLRDMTGAGLSDCKKALIESDNDITKAMELIRKRGQAIAAKREDRQAAQGCQEREVCQPRQGYPGPRNGSEAR